MCQTGGNVNELTCEKGARTLADAVRDVLSQDEDGARAYLRQQWLSQAMSALWEARRAAGLTQAQVAERMQTAQSAIARMEKDDEGRITLHKYIDFALACEAVP